MSSGGTPRRITQLSELSLARGWWWLATALAAAILLGLGALTVLRTLRVTIEIVILGLTLAAALDPLVSRLERRLPRLLATIIVYFILALLLAGLISAVVPPLVGQLQSFGNGIPGIAGRARGLLSQWTGNLFGTSLSDALKSQLSTAQPTLMRLPIALTTSLLDLVAVVFISLYTVLGARKMREFWVSLFPAGQRWRIADLVSSMASAMGGYFRGVVANGIIMGLLTSIGLMLLGIDFALVLGALTGLLELIPVVGPILAGSIIVALALLQSPTKALAGLVFMIVLQQLEGHILVPNIMRSQTDISPLLAIIALLAGAEIGGLLGAVVSIPIAAALTIFVREVVAPAIRKQTGAEPPARA